MQKRLILCLEAVERTIPPKIHRLDWIPQPVPFAVCVWFGSLSFSHMEHDLQIILQRSGSKKETVFFFFFVHLTVITVSCYLCCVNRFCCCHRSQSSQKVVVWFKVPFSSCAFQRYSQRWAVNVSTAGSCKGVIVRLMYILHIQADLALPFAHSHIAFV